MTRVIEIYDDKKKYQEISSDNLPLEIVLLKDKESILISPLVSEKKEDDKNICGYISQEDEHLFFQPDGEGLENTIFHNDEIIKKSVWLKSGDTIQIKQKIISYIVSGDRIQILVSKKPETKVVIVPPTNEIIINNNQPHVLENNIPHVKPDVKKTSKIKKRLVLFLMFILTLIAAFILFAQTAVININPKADNISLKGFFPGIKIAQRYIVISGKYTVEADKQGYRPINEIVNINSTNKEFMFTMKENPGLIKFNITPENNNKIYIDEVLLGDSIVQNNENSLLHYEVDKGEHTVEVVNSRYKKFEQKIKVEGKNIQQEYEINLQPNWGIVQFEVSPEDVQVSIYSETNKDKAVYEKRISGTTDIELISGHYTIHVTKDKFKEKIENLHIKAGDAINLKPFKLDPEDGILNLTSIPSESIIRIDGKYFGKTPQTLKLSPYVEHELELSLTGYKTIKKIIKVEPEIVIDEGLKFKENSGLVFISVSPKHADLYIDGIKQKENSGKFNLSVSNHLVSVKAKGYQTQSKKISINKFSKNISFVLQKNKLNKKKFKTHKPTKQTNNFIGQKMILVQPASFKMGSRKSEAGRSSNEQEHKVQLNYAYYLSEKEISNKQYRQFKGSHNSGSFANKSLNLDDQPVVNVSWQDAARFANWLSKKESLDAFYKEQNGQMVAVNIDAAINGYRLPFEAEWVLAARGKNQKKYPWNGNYPPLNSSGNFADVSVSTHLSNSIAGYNDKQIVSASIGSYKKNEMGFYDLGGNVSEWCQDYYSPSSGLSGNKISVNPKGLKNGTHKVVRDSSWRDSSITELRLSYRSYSKKKANDIGFRLARYAP